MSPLESNRTQNTASYTPSEVLLPDGIRDSRALNNLFTSNWRDNGCREDNSLMTQFLSLGMVVAYLYFGAELFSGGSHDFIAIATIVMALSGLLGYFGLGGAPIAQFARANINDGILAVLGVLAMASGGGMELPLIAITLMHLFDAMQGATNDSPTLATGAYENAGSARD